jgi:hypothetical protein
MRLEKTPSAYAIYSVMSDKVGFKPAIPPHTSAGARRIRRRSRSVRGSHLSPPSLRGEEGAKRQVRGYKQFLNEVVRHCSFTA